MIKDTLIAKFITNSDRSSRLLYENLRIADGSFFKLNPEADAERVCRTGHAIQSLMNIPESEHGLYVHERHLLEEVEDEENVHQN